MSKHEDKYDEYGRPIKKKGFLSRIFSSDENQLGNYVEKRQKPHEYTKEELEEKELDSDIDLIMKDEKNDELYSKKEIYNEEINGEYEEINDEEYQKLEEELKEKWDDYDKEIGNIKSKKSKSKEEVKKEEYNVFMKIRITIFIIAVIYFLIYYFLKIIIGYFNIYSNPKALSEILTLIIIVILVISYFISKKNPFQKFYDMLKIE